MNSARDQLTSGRDPLSSHRIEWNLPSSRLEYVKNHPVTYLAELHSNEKMIAPVWPKVSKTAWYDRAQLCSGYGTRQEITKISVDSPSYFVDAHRIARKFPRHREETFSGVDEAAYVLPAGQSILAATLKSKQEMARNGNKKTFMIYSDGKRGLLKNMEETTPRPPINWSNNNEFNMATKDSILPSSRAKTALFSSGRRVLTSRKQD